MGRTWFHEGRCFEHDLDHISYRHRLEPRRSKQRKNEESDIRGPWSRLRRGLHPSHRGGLHRTTAQDCSSSPSGILPISDRAQNISHVARLVFQRTQFPSPPSQTGHRKTSSLDKLHQDVPSLAHCPGYGHIHRSWG
jgi:hypothetical protein